MSISKIPSPKSQIRFFGPRFRRSRHSPLVPLVLLAAAMGILWAIASPPWRPNDETRHFGYVQYLSRNMSIPYPGLGWVGANIIASENRTDYYGQVGKKETSFPPDAKQVVASADPPLYYALMVPVDRVFRGLSVEGQLYAVRLFGSVVIFVLLVAAAYKVGELVFPDAHYFQIGLPLLLIFHPQLLFVFTSVTNDGLVALLYTLLLYNLILMVKKGLSWRRVLAIGTVTGLGILTKLSFLIALPLVFVMIAILFFQEKDRRQRWRLAPRGAAALLLPVAICGWYFFRNHLHGEVLPHIPDPTRGLNFGQVDTTKLLTGTGFTNYIIDTFLGTFSWVPLPAAAFAWFKTAIELAAGGLGVSLLAGYWRRSWLTIRPWLALLMGSLVLVFFLAATEFEVNVASAQGRYLFPVIVPFWSLFLAGLAGFVPPRWRPRATAALVAGFAVFGVWALMVQFMARVS